MRSNSYKYLWLMGSAAILLLVIAESGSAQAPDWYTDLNNFQQNITYQWRNRAFSIGLTIFGALATIDLIILGYGLVFSDTNVAPITSIIRRLIFIAFLFAILNLFWVLESFVAGFEDIAFNIYGSEMNINEYSIMMTGFDFFSTAKEAFEDNYGWLNYLSGSAVFDTIFLLLVLFGFIILAIMYAYISLEVLMALTFSPLFLSFLPFRITRSYSERYISYILHIAVKVFLFYMIFFFFWSVLEAIVNNLETTGEYGWPTLLSLGFFTYLGITALYKIPSKISQFVTENQDIDLGKFLNRIDEL